MSVKLRCKGSENLSENKIKKNIYFVLSSNSTTFAISMRYAIIAAGEGTRLSQEGVTVAKPMVAVQACEDL